MNIKKHFINLFPAVLFFSGIILLGQKNEVIGRSREIIGYILLSSALLAAVLALFQSKKNPDLSADIKKKIQLVMIVMITAVVTYLLARLRLITI